MSLLQLSYTQVKGAPLNVKCFGAVGDGVTDDTQALKNAFLAITNNSVLVFPAGTYLYDPILATTGADGGEGYLQVINKQNVLISGYGATIKQKTPVGLVGPCNGSSGDSLYQSYGLTLWNCINCTIEGITYNGNRDTTFVGAPREFYWGIYVYGGSKNNILNCWSFNCAGDGISTNRSTTGAGVVAFVYDLLIDGCILGDNNRNQLSIGGNYGVTVSNCSFYRSASVASDTSPIGGIDVEWESLVPLTQPGRVLIANNRFHNTNIIVNNYSGVSIVNNVITWDRAGIGIVIGGTATVPSYDIFINGNNINGFSGSQGIIIGGPVISTEILNNKIKASFPIYINSTIATSNFVVDGNTSTGESVYGIKVWAAGKTIVRNNSFYNPASSAGEYYYALFKSVCTISNNNWIRNSDQAPPTYGVAVLNANSIVINNTISTTGVLNLAGGNFVYGTSVATRVYPQVLTNWSSVVKQPEWGNLKAYIGTAILGASAVKQLLWQSTVTMPPEIKSFSNISYTSNNGGGNTTYNLGTYAAATSIVNAGTLSTNGLAIDNASAAILPLGYLDITADPIFITPTATTGSPLINFVLNYYPYATGLPQVATSPAWTDAVEGI